MPASPVHSHRIDASGREGGSGDAGALFPYWSFTKTAIAICAVKLAQAQILDLDAPIAGQSYTLRHLLQHTAGLRDYGQLESYHAAVAAQEPPWPRDRMLGEALAQGPLHAPGTGWRYSNIGYLFARERIEEATGQTLGAVIEALICRPLGLASVSLARCPEDFGALHWKAAARYDPRWVYHGCLIGTAQDAARLLHGLFTGGLLDPAGQREMSAVYPLGGALPGRPWTRCGYGLGLMSGEMRGVGAAVGHSGSGPFSSNAVYHFPDRPVPVTVACFTAGANEAPAEFEAARLAGE